MPSSSSSAGGQHAGHNASNMRFGFNVEIGPPTTVGQGLAARPGDPRPEPMHRMENATPSQIAKYCESVLKGTAPQSSAKPRGADKKDPRLPFTIEIGYPTPISATPPIPMPVQKSMATPLISEVLAERRRLTVDFPKGCMLPIHLPDFPGSNKVCAPPCGRTETEGGARLLTCKGCKKQSYCGKACQEKHWEEHKAACQVWKVFMRQWAGTGVLTPTGIVRT